MYEAKVSFASHGDYDNTDVVLEILSLRDERAHILAYNNYAELSLVKKMAHSPEQVIELFEDIAQKARPKAEQELQEIKDHFDLQDLQAYDLSYYARKLKEEKYALDDKKLKKYFEFEQVKS